MLTIGDINKREYKPPFFTVEGWIMLAFLGMVSGIFGALGFCFFISQFLRP